MKKKILMILLMIFPFLASACSCDKFDIETYTTAVRNYKNSTGIDYKLTVEKYTEGENNYELEEGTYKYRFSTTKEVINFASVITQYKVPTGGQGMSNIPDLVSSLKRYYVGETQKFYTNASNKIVDDKRIEEITYEEKYDENSIYNVNNLVPVFSKEYIADFNISEVGKNGDSKATFTASCPLSLNCDEDGVVKYTVVMDKNFHFKTIQFTIVNGIETSTYKYEFFNYNSNVEIVFPNDLDTY